MRKKIIEMVKDRNNKSIPGRKSCLVSTVRSLRNESNNPTEPRHFMTFIYPASSIQTPITNPV